MNFISFYLSHLSVEIFWQLKTINRRPDHLCNVAMKFYCCGALRSFLKAILVGWFKHLMQYNIHLPTSVWLIPQFLIWLEGLLPCVYMYRYSMGIWEIFWFWYYSDLSALSEASYRGYINVVLGWYWPKIGTSNLSRRILSYCDSHQYLIVITTLIRVGRFFDTIIDIVY